MWNLDGPKLSDLSQQDFAEAYKRYSAAKRLKKLRKKLERERAAQNREPMR